MTLLMRDKENREEGAHEKSVEIAKSLINMGKISLQEIADVTGLKLEEVEVLSQKQPV